MWNKAPRRNVKTEVATTTIIFGVVNGRSTNIRHSALAQQLYNVERQIDKKIQVVEHGGLSFKTNIQGDNYYIVYSWGDNNDFAREFDLRGH